MAEARRRVRQHSRHARIRADVRLWRLNRRVRGAMRQDIQGGDSGDARGHRLRVRRQVPRQGARRGPHDHGDEGDPGERDDHGHRERRDARAHPRGHARGRYRGEPSFG